MHRNAAAAPGTPTHFAGTEPLSGAREVAFAYARCLNQARHEVRGMRVHSMATRHATFDALPGAREGRFNPAGRPVTVRTVIDASLVADFDVDDFTDLQPAPHVHVTIATGVPFSACVNDDGMAVIETYDAGRIDGLVLRDPGLVRAVSATIDLMLRMSTSITSHPDRASRHAVPSGPGTPPGTGSRRHTTSSPNSLTDEERLILTLLTAGVPDATIARRVGVSQRTFDRRIRALMDRLNAATRFQAGVLAVQRGWL